MKKTYMMPTTKVIEVKLQNMIAASEIEKGSNYNGSSTILSRQGGGSWEVDEDY